MSDVDKVTEAVNNIAQAFSDLHGGAELREEIARLKAINAKLGGTVAKKSAEISELREAKKKLSDDLDHARSGGADMRRQIDEANATTEQFKAAAERWYNENHATTQKMGNMEVELNAKIDELRKMQTRGGQDEEIRDLREELHSKSIEIKSKDDKIEMLTEHLNRASAEVEELKGSLEYIQKTAENISASNALLRSEMYDMREARDAYREECIKLRDVVTEIRHTITSFDDEED